MILSLSIVRSPSVAPFALRVSHDQTHTTESRSQLRSCVAGLFVVVRLLPMEPKRPRDAASRIGEVIGKIIATAIYLAVAYIALTNIRF